MASLKEIVGGGDTLLVELDGAIARLPHAVMLDFQLETECLLTRALSVEERRESFKDGQ
jgi:hypothetical protein